MNPSADTRFRRSPELGSTDFATAAAIIDAAKYCHLGFCDNSQPYVIPMACARRGRELLLHGSVASRLMKKAGAEVPLCATVTHLDGLVLARSAFHSTFNYRSVMVFGCGREITDMQEKTAGLDALVEHLVPGRLADLRSPTRKELNATSLVSLSIEVFTTKVSQGPPEEPAADAELAVWAGVVPLFLAAGPPEVAPDMRHEIPPPEYLSGMLGPA